MDDGNQVKMVTMTTLLMTCRSSTKKYVDMLSGAHHYGCDDNNDENWRFAKDGRKRAKRTRGKLKLRYFYNLLDVSQRL